MATVASAANSAMRSAPASWKAPTTAMPTALAIRVTVRQRPEPEPALLGMLDSTFASLIGNHCQGPRSLFGPERSRRVFGDIADTSIGWKCLFGEAVHAMARGVGDGSATRVCQPCTAGRSKPARAVPAVRDQPRGRLQVAATSACRRWGAGGPVATAAARAPVTAMRPRKQRSLRSAHAHPAWGARKIGRYLGNDGLMPPAQSTVHEILRRHGRVMHPQHGHQGPYRRFEKARRTSFGRWTSRARCRSGREADAIP